MKKLLFVSGLIFYAALAANLAELALIGGGQFTGPAALAFLGLGWAFRISVTLAARETGRFLGASVLFAVTLLLWVQAAGS